MTGINDNDLVLFNVYNGEPEAYIAKGMLESNGIPCMITSEAISSVYPMPNSPLGAYKLWIRPSDAEAALSLLPQDD